MKNTGLVISHKTPRETIDTIIKADTMGIETVWSISGGIDPDLLTYYAAAAVQTKQIKFGTSIIPILTRHPNVLVGQVIVLENLVPGRLRLGIGPSHKPSMEKLLGLNFDHALGKLEEYVAILRQALYEGKIDFSGNYYNIHEISLRSDITPPRTPILISALREKAYKLAGETADGAISWMCPVDYLVSLAKPALKKGAKTKNRKMPPLIAHVPVAFSNDFDKVLIASQKQLGRYGKMPFYAQMFSDSGYPVGTNGKLSEKLIKNLVVYGDESQIRKRLENIFQRGIEELLVLPVIVDDQPKEEEKIMKLLAS